MRVAFATCAAMADGWEDDLPAARALSADYRVWDDPDVDWNAYDRVVIRSTWDYSGRVEEFVAWAERVGAERLRNPPALVAFNVDKRYLTKLSASTVPTRTVAPGEPLPELRGEVVVKPNVSAGARDTGRFSPDTHSLARGLIERIQASGRVALVQPYISSVDTTGESALVFLGGVFSHSLRKRAVLGPDEVAPTTPGELGVAEAMLQEDLVTASRCEPEALSFATEVIEEIGERFGTPLYARVDLLLDVSGPLLLELEAVEPLLYLELCPGASQRFAEAVRAG
jgi:hypothetical protein